jgi:hypothetical protein
MKDLTLEQLYQLRYYIENNKGAYYGWLNLFKKREEELIEMIEKEIKIKEGKDASGL